MMIMLLLMAMMMTVKGFGSSYIGSIIQSQFFTNHREKIKSHRVAESEKADYQIVETEMSIPGWLVRHKL